MNIRNLTRKEIERNYSYLGGGFNAAVYCLSETKVIRVSCTESDGWRVMLKIPSELRDHFGLVKVIDHWTDPTNGNVIAILEKLEPLKHDKILKDCFNTELFNVFGELPDINSILTPDNYFYDICNKAIDALKYVRENNLGVNKLDLNFLNIMKRPNGELVLSDPFGSLFKFEEI